MISPFKNLLEPVLNLVALNLEYAKGISYNNNFKFLKNLCIVWKEKLWKDITVFKYLKSYHLRQQSLSAFFHWKHLKQKLCKNSGYCKQNT